MGIINKRPRIIAIGCSVHGQPFQVIAAIAPPDDFIESAQPVRQSVQPPADWPTPDEIDAIIGTACYGYA